MLRKVKNSPEKWDVDVHVDGQRYRKRFSGSYKDAKKLEAQMKAQGYTKVASGIRETSGDSWETRGDN